MISAKDINVSRQYPLVAFQRFDVSQLESGTATMVVKVPFNSIVIGGALVITTAFDSGTSDTLTVGDNGGSGGTPDADRYAASVNGQSLGKTALAMTGFQFLTPGEVTLTWTGAGAAPTQGAGYLLLEYITEGRHSFEVVPSY